MVMTKNENENSTQAMKWGNIHPICTKECASKIFSITPQFVSYPLAKSASLYLYMSELKETFPHTLLVVKASIWGASKVLDFCEGPSKVVHWKQKNMMHLQPINMNCKYDIL